MSVQSLTRAFDILKVVAGHSNGIGVTAIANEVGLHKSTVSRLLGTMEGIGAVTKRPNYDGYSIGLEILELATQATLHQKLLHLSRPFLVELSDVTTESTTLEVPDGNYVHYLYQVQSNHQIRVNYWAGHRHAMHLVTSGVLFMHDWPNSKIERYFAAELEVTSHNTITEVEIMRKKISAAKLDRYIMETDMFEIGLTGISAPIYGVGNKIVGAINISGPNFRFPEAEQLPVILERLLKATATISDRLKATFTGKTDSE